MDGRLGWLIGVPLPMTTATRCRGAGSFGTWHCRSWPHGVDSNQGPSLLSPGRRPFREVGTKCRYLPLVRPGTSPQYRYVSLFPPSRPSTEALSTFYGQESSSRFLPQPHHHSLANFCLFFLSPSPSCLVVSHCSCVFSFSFPLLPSSSPSPSLLAISAFSAPPSARLVSPGCS